MHYLRNVKIIDPAAHIKYLYSLNSKIIDR